MDVWGTLVAWPQSRLCMTAQLCRLNLNWVTLLQQTTYDAIYTEPNTKLESLHFTSTFEFTFASLVFVTFCVSFVFVLVCIHILYLCAVCRKVIEPHDTSGSSHNLLRLLSNSTPHRSKPTLSLPQYRGIQNTEYGGIQNTEEYLQTRERAMKQRTVIIKFNLTSIWCHVAVLRTKTRYKI